MAPIKFEEHIREKLQEREMAPSEGAWEKLASQLDDEKKSGSRFLWYAIAASFIGIVIVGSFVFSSEENTKNTPLVKETKTESVPSEIEQVQTELLPKTPLESTKEKTVVASEEVKPVIERAAPYKPKAKENVSKQANVVVANVETPIKKSVNSMIKTEQSIEEIKIEAVVAKVKELQEKNSGVTAAEIDALLQNAQREIQTQRILSSEKVDATALLNDVELELEKTFRDKVFDALGDSFNKVRTAVVDRNN